MNTSSVICLPPGVPGAAKGQLVLQVVGLDWTHRTQKRPQLPYLVVRWWGDAGMGVSLPCVPGESVDFPVVAGPKRFARYLRDCQSLPVAVIDFTTNMTVGVATVDVRFLDVHAPVQNASFPVLSPEGTRLASLSLSLEVLYNTTGGAVTSFELAEHRAGLGLSLPPPYASNTAATPYASNTAATPYASNTAATPHASSTAANASTLPAPRAAGLPSIPSAAQPVESLTTATLAPTIEALTPEGSHMPEQQGQQVDTRHTMGSGQPARSGVITTESQVAGSTGQQAVRPNAATALAVAEEDTASQQVDTPIDSTTAHVPGQEQQGELAQKAAVPALTSYQMQPSAVLPSSTLTQPEMPPASDALLQSMDKDAELRPSLPQLDLFELLQSTLSRRFDDFYRVFKLWEGDAAVQHTIPGLLQLLQKHRVFPYHTLPDQLLYLTTVLDPLGDLQLALDTIMQAIRESQEAGLRVRTGQLGPALPLLQPLIQQLDLRSVELRSLFQQSQAGGMAGRLGLQSLMAWLHAINGCTSDANRQALRYLTVLLLHDHSGGPLGTVSNQDLEKVLRTVQALAAAQSAGASMQGDTLALIPTGASQPPAVPSQPDAHTAHSAPSSPSGTAAGDVQHGAYGTDSAARTPHAALQRLKRRALRVVRPSAAASQQSPPSSPAIAVPLAAQSLSGTAIPKVPSAPHLGTAGQGAAAAEQPLPGSNAGLAGELRQAEQQQAVMAQAKPGPTAGLLRPTAQFLDLTSQVPTATTNRPAAHVQAGGVTIWQQGPMKVVVGESVPVALAAGDTAQHTTSVFPVGASAAHSANLEGVAAFPGQNSTASEGKGGRAASVGKGGREAKPASMDAEELQRVLRDAYGLRDQLDRAIAAGRPRSAGSSPVRKRLAGSNLTAATLAAILQARGEDHASSETAGLLLDLLSSSPAEKPMPVDAVQPRQQNLSRDSRAYNWAVGGAGTGFSRSPPAPAQQHDDARSEAATEARHTPSPGTGARYDSAWYHDDGTPDHGSVTDDEGAAHFTEQQLLRHLFFERVQPAAASHTDPSSARPALGSPHVAHPVGASTQLGSGSPGRQGDLSGKAESLSGQADEFALMPPSSPTAENEASTSIGIQLAVTSLALMAASSLSQQPPVSPVSGSAGLGDSVQLLLKVRASCSAKHCFCLLKCPPGSSQASAGQAGHESLWGGPVWLPVCAVQDALTAPPAKVVMELWQLPSPASAKLAAALHGDSQLATLALHAQLDAELVGGHAQLLGIAQATLELTPSSATPSPTQHASGGVSQAQQFAGDMGAITQQRTRSESYVQENAQVADQQQSSSRPEQGPAGALPEQAAFQPSVAAAHGVYPLVDVLGGMGLDSPTHSQSLSGPMHLSTVGSMGIHAELLGCVPLVRHTWRVTVCGAAGLPSEAVLEAAGLPVPTARYVKYLYPGEPCALVTEEVPATDAPIFAATALHSMVLPSNAAPNVQLLVGTDIGQQERSVGATPPEPQLLFEVWDKWAAGPDTCIAAARLPLSTLVSLPPGPHASLQLPLHIQHTTSESIILSPPTQLTTQQGRALPTDKSFPPTQQSHNLPTDKLSTAGMQGSIQNPADTSSPAGNSQVAEPSVPSARVASVSAPASGPCLEIRLQAERVVVGPSSEPLSTSHHDHLVQGPAHPAHHAHPAGSPGPPNPTTSTNPAAGTTPGGLIRQPMLARPASAVLSVRIVAACGLQAAVQEAAAWLGGASAVLGKALQLGPHAFMTLQLFPANQALAKRVPELRTPFQAQAFCPRYDYHSQLELQLDTATLRALLSQQACVEVYHHPSRSLAALAAAQLAQQQAAGGKALPQPSGQGHSDQVNSGNATRQVLLGSGSLSLASLLLRPQGIQCWVLLRSARGLPVGGVQLALQFTRLAGRHVDTCLSAPAPLDQAPNEQLQLFMPHDVPYPAVDLHLFQDQWARCTLHIEHVTLHPPPVQTAAAAVAARAGSKQFKYYITYTLPGSDAEVTTTSCAATHNKDGSSKPTSTVNIGGNSSSWGSGPSIQHVPLQHVAVHWVRADARLAGALTRAPLRLCLWRAHERGASTPAPQTGSTAAGSPAPATTTSAWLSTQMMGSVDVDLSQLVLRAGRGSKPQAAARWVSGTYSLIDPAAACFTPMHVRVKVLLELSPPSTPSGAVLAAGTWQPTAAYSSASSTVEEETSRAEQQQGSPAPQQDEQQAGRQVDATANATKAEEVVVSSTLGSRQASPGVKASSAHADSRGVSPMRVPIETQGTPVSTPAVRPSTTVNGTPPAGPGLSHSTDMYEITRGLSPASVHNAAGLASTEAIDAGTCYQPAVPCHPILGTSPSAASSQQLTQPHASTPDKTSPHAPTMITPAGESESEESDPRVNLRQQLQDLDVLRLQWFNRLHADDVDTVVGGSRSTVIPCPDPSAHSTPRGAGVPAQLQTQRQVAPELGQMARELEQMVSRLGQHAAASSQLSAPRAQGTFEFEAQQQMGDGLQQHWQQAVGTQRQAAPVQSAAQVEDLHTAGVAIQGRAAMPEQNKYDVAAGSLSGHTGSAGTAGGVWVSTVRSAANTQAQASLIALETCSDDGGGDVVLGGYSASEADTDELLASIPVAHVEQHGMHMGGWSDDEDPRNTTTHAQPATAQQHGTEGEGSNNTACSSGQAATTGLAKGAVADAREDVEWMFAFGRGSQPAAGMTAAYVTTQHPGLRSPQSAAQQATAITRHQLTSVESAAAGLHVGGVGVASETRSAAAMPLVTGHWPQHPCDTTHAPHNSTTPATVIQPAARHDQRPARVSRGSVGDGDIYGVHPLVQRSVASQQQQAAFHAGDDDLFSVRKSHAVSQQHVSAIQAIQHPVFSPQAARAATSSVASQQVLATGSIANVTAGETSQQRDRTGHVTQPGTLGTATLEAASPHAAQRPYVGGAVSSLQARLDALLMGFQEQVSGAWRRAADNDDEDDPITLNARMGIQAVRISHAAPNAGPHDAGTMGRAHSPSKYAGPESDDQHAQAGQHTGDMGSGTEHSQQGLVHARQRVGSYSLTDSLAGDVAPAQGDRVRFANALPPIQPDFQLRFSD